MNILKLLLYGGIDEEDYKRIEKDIWIENRRNLMTYCFIMMILLMGLFFVAFNSDLYSRNYSISFAMEAAGMAILMCLLRFLPAKKSIVSVCLNLIFVLTFGATIYISCILAPDRPSVSFMVLVIFLPQIVSIRPINMIARIILAMLCFIVFNEIYCSGQVLYINVLNCLVFGILIIIFSTLTIKGNVTRYLGEYKLRYVGDTDLLTGVKNRNCYERLLNNIELKFQDELNCIFVDLNGLHVLNNTKGHEAGDIALKSVADELRHSFEHNDIYRIGGDEFVVFVADVGIDNVKMCIEACYKMLCSKEIFISYGVKNMKKEDLNVSLMIKDAEMLMYESKEEFYKARGIAHR